MPEIGCWSLMQEGRNKTAHAYRTAANCSTNTEGITQRKWFARKEIREPIVALRKMR
jgi:hypothetical protein